MRLSKLAVCVLFLCPPPILACWKDEPGQTSWLDSTASYYRGPADDRAESRSIVLSLMGAGLASVGLVAVSFRAFSRTAGPVSR